MTRKARKLAVWLIPTFIATVLLYLLYPAGATDTTGAKACHLTILHTNDVHAHDEPLTVNGRQIGGLTRIGHMIRTLRQRQPEALAIDAGDMFQGTPLYSKYHGEVEVELFNKIGYDIFTIGNHEFDDGAKNLANQLKNAKFQIVNCNLDFSKAPELQRLVVPYVVREINHQKFAFIGVITPDLNQIALKTEGVTVKATGKDWTKPVQETIAKVREQGINKIILVSHVGLELDKELARLPDVDAIIGGHSHTRLDRPILIEHADGSTATIVQTGSFTRTLGKLDLCFDSNGVVMPTETQYKLINMSDRIYEDADLRDYVAEKEKPLLPLRHTVAGTAANALDNSFRNIPGDSALGDVICDALALAGKNYGVEIAFENRGGIRGRIERGPVTLEKLEEVLPFDNKAVFAAIDGACLLRTLEHSVGGGLGGPFLDVHGLKIAYDSQAPSGHRIVFALARDKGGDWKPISAVRKYKVAINDYSFHGGEGYDFKSATDVHHAPEKIADILKDYLIDRHVVGIEKHDRIIPVRTNLLSVTACESKTSAMVWTASIANALPNATVLFVCGDRINIELVAGDIPVPLSQAEIVAKARTNEAGCCKALLRTNKRFVAAVILPGRGKTTTRKQISAPVELR